MLQICPESRAIRKHLQTEGHRRQGVHLHRAHDFLQALFIECLVAGDDACAVDEDVRVAAFAPRAGVGRGHGVVVGDVHAVARRPFRGGVFREGFVDVLLVDVPDDYFPGAFLEGHAAHNTPDSRGSACDKHAFIPDTRHISWVLVACRAARQVPACAEWLPVPYCGPPLRPATRGRC